MASERFYVTTPIYYVNDRPHVGHAYTSVLADVFAAYHRMLGIETWFLTGTDEHGQKVQDSAEARGVTPQALCDEMAGHFHELLQRLAVHNDDFIRTTEARHTSIVTRVLTKLHENGDVYLGTYEGWYCSRCERYWTDKEVEERGGGRCPDQPELHAVERLAEENYYFRMSAYADRLRAAIESDELLIHPPKRKNEVLGFLAQGLNDLCISRNRERLSWGVPLPFDDRYVCYVWVDALFNYKSAIGYLHDDAEQRERHDGWWPADVHLIGKDILTTHAVYWPTMLLAVGEPLPRQILAHGWLLDTRGGKLSKTKRQDAEAADDRPVPTIEGLLDVFGVAGTRWFLATAMKPGDDTSFDWEIVRERVNTDLANGIGNTANRLLKMAAGACDGRFPALDEGGEREHGVRDAALAAIEAARAMPETLDVTSVVSAVRAGIDAISLYLSDTTPWKLVKTEEGLPRARQILGWSLESLRLLALAVHPILPTSMGVVRAAVGLEGDLDFENEARFGVIAEGAELAPPPNLFPRVSTEDLPSA
jgi:methionyl-tRNA synthetase